MNKRTVLLVGVALVLGAAYLCSHIDWHTGDGIHILCSKSIPSLRHGGGDPGLIFHLVDRQQVVTSYPLTSIEFVETQDPAAISFHPLWYIVATNTPVPTTVFPYGRRIKGMAPEIASALPEALEPDTSYTLLVEAGKHLKGQCTFRSP